MGFILKNIGFRGFHGGVGVISKRQSAIRFKSLTDAHEYMISNNLKFTEYEVQSAKKFNGVTRYRHKLPKVMRDNAKIVYY